MAKSIFNFEKENEGFAPCLAQPDDVMSLIFTSGTTGDPKGVMLTCKNFVCNAESLMKTGYLKENEVILGLLPLHHCYAFTTSFMIPLVGGYTATFQPILKGPEIVKAMQETGVSFAPAVPKLVSMFYQAIFDNVKKQSSFKRFMFAIFYSISRFFRVWFGIKIGKLFFVQIHKRFGPKFKFFVSGGAKLDPEAGEKLWNLGITVMEGYGLTETAPIICTTSPYHFAPGSVGPSVPDVEVKIDNPAKDGVGEIIMRGPNLMKGYYKREDYTAEVVKDGWLHTGDLGFIDKKGYVHITGRAKDVIVLGSGKNVYPEDVEKHYEKSPIVAEVCVFGQKMADGLSESLSEIGRASCRERV